MSHRLERLSDTLFAPVGPAAAAVTGGQAPGPGHACSIGPTEISPGTFSNDYVADPE